jgi:hypothetical protein
MSSSSSSSSSSSVQRSTQDNVITFVTSLKPSNQVDQRSFQCFQTVMDGIVASTEKNSAPWSNKKKDSCDVVASSGTMNDQLHTGCAKHGFVSSTIEAYNHHHNLILRPDDLWMAILTQMSLYINARGEKLRAMFVNHQGKKELKVKGGGCLRSANYEALTLSMTEEIKKNLNVDVASWSMANFSTSTINDRVAYGVALMASMQQYFSYRMELSCGIPKMTLLGTADDYVDILNRVMSMHQYDDGTGVLVQWQALLKPILQEFINVKLGKTPQVENFWSRICHNLGGGSGPTYISGWLSAFVVFDDEGKYRGNERFIKTWNQTLTSDFPIINMNEIPQGFVHVPVTVDDNGVENKCTFYAGSFGSNLVNDSTLAPRNDWVLIRNKDQSK